MQPERVHDVKRHVMHTDDWVGGIVTLSDGTRFENPDCEEGYIISHGAQGLDANAVQLQFEDFSNMLVKVTSGGGVPTPHYACGKQFEELLADVSKIEGASRILLQHEDTKVPKTGVAAGMAAAAGPARDNSANV